LLHPGKETSLMANDEQLDICNDYKSDIKNLNTSMVKKANKRGQDFFLKPAHS